MSRTPAHASPNPPRAGDHSASRHLVIDTNVALDLLVFNEPHHAALMAPLRDALTQSHWVWLATAAMGEELRRVLSYPQLAPRVAHYGHTPDSVMQAWQRLVRLSDAAPKTPCTCKDPDDQIYLDLAAAHRCWLLSKDIEVLRMKKHLAALGAGVCTAQAFIAAQWGLPA